MDTQKKEEYTIPQLKEMIANKVIEPSEELIEKIAEYDKILKMTEGGFQSVCFKWFHNTYKHLRGLLYHVPNGEKRDKVTANLLKAKGVVAGIPDLVFHYKGRTYFFELKKPDGTGKLSDNQNKIIDQLNNQRFMVWIIEDFSSFKYLIECIIGDTSLQFSQGLTKSDYYYKHKIFDYIYSLADCQVVKISDVCEDTNIDKFTHFVSVFMVEGFGKLSGFEVLFTPDYKAFYKKEIGTTKTVNYGN